MVKDPLCYFCSRADLRRCRKASSIKSSYILSTNDYTEPQANSPKAKHKVSLQLFGTLQLTTTAIVRCPWTNVSKPGHTKHLPKHSVSHDDYSHPRKTSQYVYGLPEFNDVVRDLTKSKPDQISEPQCHHQFCNVKQSSIQELFMLRIAHQCLHYMVSKET